MESKTFIKLLRKIIREEVSKAVKSVLNESNSHVSSNLDLKNEFLLSTFFAIKESISSTAG